MSNLHVSPSQPSNPSHIRGPGKETILSTLRTNAELREKLCEKARIAPVGTDLFIWKYVVTEGAKEFINHSFPGNRIRRKDFEGLAKNILAYCDIPVTHPRLPFNRKEALITVKDITEALLVAHYTFFEHEEKRVQALGIAGSKCAVFKLHDQATVDTSFVVRELIKKDDAMIGHMRDLNVVYSAKDSWTTAGQRRGLVAKLSIINGFLVIGAESKC